MKRLLNFAILILAALPTSQAQEAPRRPNTAVIAGMVTKEPGSEPLRKVLVQLITEDQKQGGNYTATTDSDGHFLIENIQPGRYRLFLERTGFIQINSHNRKVDGTVLNFYAGQEMKEILLSMLSMAVITGRVVDEDGDPLANFNVSVGKRKAAKAVNAENSGGERTNDRGEYRISGLFPGQYYIKVTPAPDFTNFARPATPEAESKPSMSYVTTYYPGTTDSVQATPVAVHAGDELPINFTILPTLTYRVKGILTGISPGQKPSVQLIARGTNTMTLNSADVKPDGRFEIRNVAPGSYWIASYSGTDLDLLASKQRVNVVAADVDGLKLTPVHPFPLTGHLRIDGASFADLTQYSVYLRNFDSLDDDAAGDMGFAMVPGSGPVARVDRFGNFKWTDVPPGKYIAQLTGGDTNIFLKSATLGAMDANTAFRVSGPATLDLVASMKAAVLEGYVLDKDQPVANCAVVAVPEEKYRITRQHFGVGTTDQTGHFALHGLTPGSYTVFAWQDLDDGLFYDPDFLKSQDANGISVGLEEGSHKTIELKLSPVSEEWQ